jgi:uncharacterized protein (TIGR02246 family)
MPVVLPSLLSRYVDATNARDADALLALFAPDAVVRDEGHTYAGVAEIRAWREATGAQYEYVAEPQRVRERGEQTVLTATLTGTFPGSPVDLDFDFTIDNGRIVALAIHA